MAGTSGKEAEALRAEVADLKRRLARAEASKPSTSGAASRRSGARGEAAAGALSWVTLGLLGILFLTSTMLFLATPSAGKPVEGASSVIPFSNAEVSWMTLDEYFDLPQEEFEAKPTMFQVHLPADAPFERPSDALYNALLTPFSRPLQRPSDALPAQVHKSWCGACKRLKADLDSNPGAFEQLAQRFHMVSIGDDESKGDLRMQKFETDGSYIPRTFFAPAGGQRGEPDTSIWNEQGRPDFKYFYSQALHVEKGMRNALHKFGALDRGTEL